MCVFVTSRRIGGGKKCDKMAGEGDKMMAGEAEGQWRRGRRETREARKRKRRSRREAELGSGGVGGFVGMAGGAATGGQGRLLHTS